MYSGAVSLRQSQGGSARSAHQGAFARRQTEMRRAVAGAVAARATASGRWGEESCRGSLGAIEVVRSEGGKGDAKR